MSKPTKAARYSVRLAANNRQCTPTKGDHDDSRPQSSAASATVTAEELNAILRRLSQTEQELGALKQLVERLASSRTASTSTSSPTAEATAPAESLSLFEQQQRVKYARFIIIRRLKEEDGETPEQLMKAVRFLGPFFPNSQPA